MYDRLHLNLSVGAFSVHGSAESSLLEGCMLLGHKDNVKTAA